jgi:ATP/maltotriose-dependent transcriptional regulator MalT
VNTYIRNIYAKFQVQDRSSAVPGAGELWLLLAAAAS